MVKLLGPSVAKKTKKWKDMSESKVTKKITKKTDKTVKIQLKDSKKSKLTENSGEVKKTVEKKIQRIVKKVKKKPQNSEKSGKKDKIPEQQIIKLGNKTSVESKNPSIKEKKRKVSTLEAPRALKNEVNSECAPTGSKKKRPSDESVAPSKKKLKTLKEGKPPKKKKTAPEEVHGAELEKEGGKSKVTENILAHAGNLEVTEAHVRSCIQAVLKLTNKTKEDTKRTLLPDDNNPIFLQITCIKVPKTPRMQLRIFLPHMMVGPTDEVALFVADLEKGKRKDHEKTIDHWETIFRDKNVTRVKEIIPMNKVKAEYSQYEMKLKLGRMFDFFLVDGRISGHMTHLLGKTFKKSAQPPTPVKLQRDNLKSEIDNALRKTCMEIHGRGNCHSVRIGTVTMPEQEILENVIEACKALDKIYPGGRDNIRSILIKTRKSLGIPVYYSIKNKNKVPVTKITPKRPKAYKTVEGELSTVSGNVIVKVEPGGRVKLQKMKKVARDVKEKAH